ncbi:MAG: hypothetical protein ACI4T1_03620 [Christensenellales bacterium]
MTREQIRQDLKDIRYYYSRKSVIEKGFLNTGKINIDEVVEKYNKAICKANPQMYDIYISLYLENNSQESLADKFGYCVQHVSKLNCKLVDFFKKEFDKEEK